MRKFLTIWIGQLLSTIGSNMTNFAQIVRAWEKTGTATALAFISFAFLAPTLITGLFTGIILDIGESIFKPLILSRTDGNTIILGSISTAAGIGGVIGGLIIIFWGEFKNNFRGFVLGMMGAGICKFIFGFGQSTLIWIPLQFCSSLNFPLIYSSLQALYLSKINTNLLGRIFAFSSWLRLGVGAISALLGGILADQIFEPLMMTNNILTPIFGTGSGAGMGFQYSLFSAFGIFISIIFWNSKNLSDLEKNLPDI
ncbi:MAG: hypothetical protein IGQ45_13140 [Cyanobacterium sp. T60_A2020_053]|nr:hypothetical protein [Cyanobacterium sp. T60_A2020_053]